MPDVINLATAEDYTALFGQPEDTERLSALLTAASGYLLAKMGDYTAGADKVFDLNAKTVVCSMVNRALSVPNNMSGISSFSQSAGSYSASVSLLDQYMRPLPSELDLLGLSSGGIFTVHIQA